MRKRKARPKKAPVPMTSEAAWGDLSYSLAAARDAVWISFFSESIAEWEHNGGRLTG